MRPSLIKFIGAGAVAAGTTYSLTVGTSNYSTTLNNTSLLFERQLVVSESSYTTTFSGITLSYQQVTTLSVDTSSSTTAFNNIALEASRAIMSDPTSYTSTYNDITLQYNGGFTIEDNYSRSSVNLTGSSVVGSGDSAIIEIKPRLQESEVVSSQSRWLEPSARVTGVNGYRPTFKFLDYGSGADKYHGYPWQTTRRPMFSYDRETWYYFDTQTVNASTIEFRHNTAFTGDTVYISRNRQTTVDQVGAWLEGLETTYSSMFGPSDAAVSFTPTLGGWSGQDFISDEFSSQTNELGGTIPATPFYSAEINDTSLMPPGDTKYLALIIAGVHAGEDHGHFAMRKFVEYLLGNSTEAQELRRYYRVLIYPMLNAPGNEGGGWRGSFTQGTGGADDANRHFDESGSLLEIVDKPKAVMISDMGAETPDWMIDWHGAYNNDWGFHSDGLTLHNDLMSKLATNSGFTVNDTGNTVVGFTSRYFQDVIGSDMAITMEHGATTPISDADLATWGQAVVESLHQMRAEGDFTAPGDTTYSLAVTEASFATTGNAVGFNETYSLVVDTIGWSTTYNNITPVYGRLLSASTDSYTTTFNNISLSQSQIFSIDTVGYTTTFNSVGAQGGRLVPVDSSVFTSILQDTGLQYNRLFTIDSSDFTTTFNNIIFTKGFVLNVGTLPTTSTFNSITLSYEGITELSVDAVTYTTTGNNIGLSVSRQISANSNSYTTSFNNVLFITGFTLSIDPQNYTTSLNEISPITSRELGVISSNFTTTLNNTQLTYPYTAYTYRERIKFDVYITRSYEIGSVITPSLKKGLEL